MIHSLTHAVAALRAADAAGCEIILLSASDAGVSAGPGWFGAMIRAAREAVPRARARALLDCGSDAGAAQSAIRAGIEAIVFTGRADVAARLKDIATAKGAELVTAQPTADLDLVTLFFADAETLQRRCTTVLASAPRFC